LGVAWAERDGRRIHYELHGAGGDPTALIHGSWVDLHTWDAVVPGLARALDVITYDRCGHGASAAGPRPHPVADDAADLASVLEAANLYPAHLVGHSYGGAVALRLALDRPELVRSVAMHEPPFFGWLRRDPRSAAEGELVAAEIERVKALVRRGEPEEAARQFSDRIAGEPGAFDRFPTAFRAQLVAQAGRWAEEFGDPEAYDPDPGPLRELLLPILLTTGDRSPGVLHRISSLLTRDLRNVREQTLDDTGHVPQVTRPDLYVAVLGTFLIERNVPST
jgi:pimeloyl-ACP methyl ester carboxylesterase